MKIYQMSFRKTISIISVIFFITFILHSCDEPEKNEGEKFKENLSSFNNTMSEIDNTLDIIDSMQNEIDNIEEERALGIISDDEAVIKLNKINNNIGKQLSSSYNSNPVIGIPAWAKQLGLSAPANMSFDSDNSQATSENNPNEGFNSVILIYKGNYTEAIKQAGIVARKANIPMSQDYKDALTLSKEYDIETIRGASYMNFKFGSDNNPQYNISITVDNDGTLTINATDTKALMKQLEQ